MCTKASFTLSNKEKRMFWYRLMSTNLEDPDQTVHICPKTHFRRAWPVYHSRGWGGGGEGNFLYMA